MCPLGSMMWKQSGRTASNTGIFRPGKSSHFCFLHHWAALIGVNGGLRKRLYPRSILHSWSVYGQAHQKLFHSCGKTLQYGFGINCSGKLQLKWSICNCSNLLYSAVLQRIPFCDEIFARAASHSPASLEWCKRLHQRRDKRAQREVGSLRPKRLHRLLPEWDSDGDWH